MKKLYLRKKAVERNRQLSSFARRSRILCLPVFFLLFNPAKAQQDSTVVDQKRLRTIGVASAVGYTAGLATLNHVWYKDTERRSFRFFNDNAEWKQVDKTGHFFASFHISDLTARALRSANVAERKADLIGALSGLMLTLPIEIFDGYSDGYGASTGDLLADAAGPVFFLAQKFAWHEIRIHPKFSFHRTDYPSLRPELLGDNLLSEVVKDYNGQTYWLSLDVDKFTTFPPWLNIAVGYGAHDMVFARDVQNLRQGYNPYRQYYLALDFDVTAIETRSKWVKALLYALNTVRIPAPALEFSRGRVKFHPFYL